LRPRRGAECGGLGAYVAGHFSWHRFAAIQIWIFVLFLVYTFVTELNTRLGEDALRRVLFTAAPTRPA
jgi:hypothetical protein